MTRPVLRTARIELRPMSLEHLPLLHGLDSDPQVMRFLLGRARTPEEIDAFWGPRCARDGGSGLGWWVGFDGGEFIGWWQLGDTVSPGSGLSTPEVGWRVRRARWGMGLATEGARALLTHGFESLGATSVWAETMAVNAASRAVMRKLGMRHTRTYFPEWDEPLPGADSGEVVYEVTRGEWAGRLPVPDPL